MLRRNAVISRFAILAMLALLSLAACESTPPQEPTPTPAGPVRPSATGIPAPLPAPSPTAPAGPELTAIAATLEVETIPLSTPLPQFDNELFSDEFKSASAGWDEFSGTEGSAALSNGEYVIEVNLPHTRVLGLPRGVVFGDTVIYVSARHVGGPGNAGFGVLCRYQDDENYYFFLATADNFALIGKRVEGDLIGLSSSVLEPMDSILPGDVPNLLTAACVGDQLTLWVNARYIASARDANLPAGGNIGLFATAFDQPGARVGFDDLTVFAP